MIERVLHVHERGYPHADPPTLAVRDLMLAQRARGIDSVALVAESTPGDDETEGWGPGYQLAPADATRRSEFENIVRRLEPDVVHLHGTGGFYRLAEVAAGRVGAPVATSESGYAAAIERGAEPHRSPVESLMTLGKRNAVRLIDTGLIPLTEPLRTHVVICGFPRSGSTLLQLICETCVADTRGFGIEVPALHAATRTYRQTPFLLSKYPSDVLHLDEIRRHYRGRRGKPLFVVTTRDPLAVLTSRHKAYPSSRGYYVSPDRWRRNAEAILAAAGSADVLVIDYAQLVLDLPDVQQRLIDFIGWPVTRPFAEYLDAAPERDSMTEGALGGLRAPDPTRLKVDEAAHAQRIDEVRRAIPDLDDLTRRLNALAT